MSKQAIRYVEVTYNLPGLDVPQFRAIITRQPSPNTALDEAIHNTKRAHPNATEVEEYMQRVVTEERAYEIETQIREGSWTGWEFRSL